VERRKGEDYFILDETIRVKRLIKTLYQMVNRFIANIFHGNWYGSYHFKKHETIS